MPKRSRGTSPISTPPATTRASRATSPRPKPPTAAFRDRTYGKVATLSAAELADAINEYERIEAIATRALYYAHMSFSTNMADPARGALVAKLGEKAAGLETQLLFFGLEWAAIEDDTAAALLEDPALDHWRHWLSAQRVFRPYLLTEPEEKILTEKAVSRRLGLVAALRGGARRHPRRPRRSRARRARDGDGQALLGRPRRAPGAAEARHRRRCSRRSAPAPRSSTRSSSTSGSTTGCVATRPGSRRATSPTRRPTTPCRR